MLVLHDTGNVRGDSASGNFNYFSTNPSAIAAGVTAHAFIDDKQLIKMMPAEKIAWQVAGSINGKPFNNDSYGLELCNLLTQQAVDAQFDNAAKYFAQMCLIHGLDPYNDIKSHHELSVMGKVSGGHSDPDAYLAKWGYDMDMFRGRVDLYVGMLR